jgi:hypothetical protein
MSGEFDWWPLSKLKLLAAELGKGDSIPDPSNTAFWDRVAKACSHKSHDDDEHSDK